MVRFKNKKYLSIMMGNRAFVHHHWGNSHVVDGRNYPVGSTGKLRSRHLRWHSQGKEDGNYGNSENKLSLAIKYGYGMI